MKEIVNIQIGQGGIQTCSAMWELFCAEHGIQADGKLNPEYSNTVMEDLSASTFFHKSSCGQYVPRSIMIDSEPTVTDEIRNGTFRSLFHPSSIISDYECSGGNFARGLFSLKAKFVDQVSNEVRRQLERCEHCSGIVLYRALGGGTGTGLSVVIGDILLDYAKIMRLELPIYPSFSLANSTVEPYNAILGEHFSLEDLDIGLLFDNEALYDICRHFLNIHDPSYNNINRLVTQAFSAITSGVRFESMLGNNLTTMQTNLVPYPRIRFPMSNYSPIESTDQGDHNPTDIFFLTSSVFSRHNQLVKVDTRIGKYIACSLFYRGDVQARQIYEQLDKLKINKEIQFVDFCPTGFKVGIMNTRPTVIPRSHLRQTGTSVALVTNHGCIGQVWQRLLHRFQILLSKRAFLHWFISEGLEEGEFGEANDNMEALVRDYEEFCDIPLSEQSTYDKQYVPASRASDQPVRPLSRGERRPIKKENATKCSNVNDKSNSNPSMVRLLQDETYHQLDRESHKQMSSSNATNWKPTKQQNSYNFNNFYDAADWESDGGWKDMNEKEADEEEEVSSTCYDWPSDCFK